MAHGHHVTLLTATAPVNIAVIKYWGKRNEKLILPINDSISVTLSSEQMSAKTSVAFSASLSSDRLWLNGKEEPVASNPRLVSCLSAVRARAAAKGLAHADWKVHICSQNNFPTAAGLASSAAGYACLVYALCGLYGLSDDDGVNVSELARLGSGSACRSVFGGFVHWDMGSRDDGADSVATQVKPALHWPQMRILILVANDCRKKVSSSVGMRLGVETSALLKFRAENSVPRRKEQMLKAITERDFSAFCELTMRDSNEMHAACLDTFPPCTYMNDTSHAVATLVHEINRISGRYVACYTFDAGPNACVFLLEPDVALVAGLVAHYFPSEDADSFVRGQSIPHAQDAANNVKTVSSSLQLPVRPGALKYVIHTTVGDGPALLADDPDVHLLDSTGMPKAAA